MKVSELHSWDLEEEAAVHLQECLRSSLRHDGWKSNVCLVAGADVAYEPGGDAASAAVVVMDLPSRAVVEERRTEGPVAFPYVPGLLSFREGPLLIEVFRLLGKRPDAVLFDGHGFAHPRRFGLACHMGLLLDVPSIGCAKAPLVGEYGAGTLAEEAGACAQLIDGGEEVGMVVRTKQGVNPIFVSVGQKIDLNGAVQLVLKSTYDHRLPEPLRRAHQAAQRFCQSEEAKAS